MTKCWIVTVCAILALLMMGGQSFGANRQGAIILTPIVGYYHYTDKRHIDNQTMGGFNLGYGLYDQWSAEFFFGKISSRQERNDKRGVSGELYLLNGAYHFRVFSPLQPYVFGGVGAMRLGPETNGDANTQANFDAGGGLAYFFSDNIALRGDVRDVYTPVGGKNDYLASFGVSILFFGKAPGTEVEVLQTDQPDSRKVVVGK